MGQFLILGEMTHKNDINKFQKFPFSQFYFLGLFFMKFFDFSN